MPMKILISGGGTGGHIFPALSIANAVKRRYPDAQILFVGALGRMEMERVPAAGYEIIGLPVAGFDRRRLWRNFAVVLKMLRSMRLARKILRNFRPDVAVGVGGYASGPTLKAAQKKGIPTLLQEQNSYAGVTNKLLASRARRICVAYEGMKRFFPKERIVMTGNPLRGRFAEGADPAARKAEALAYFGLEADKPVVLVVGGSLGTRTLNNMMKANVERITAEGRLQVIWQTGKFYEREMTEFMQGRSSEGIWRGAFIDRMDLAYAAADVVVGRSGAGTVSELCLIGKPAIFVPSPNVAEDHQTKNALALVEKGAALLVRDGEAVSGLFPVVEALLADPERMRRMAANIRVLGIADSAERIVDEIVAVVSTK